MFKEFILKLVRNSGAPCIRGPLDFVYPITIRHYRRAEYFAANERARVWAWLSVRQRRRCRRRR